MNRDGRVQDVCPLATKYTSRGFRAKWSTEHRKASRWASGRRHCRWLTTKGGTTCSVNFSQGLSSLTSRSTNVKFASLPIAVGRTASVTFSCCRMRSDNYRKNPIVLSGHDRMKPVGTAKVYVSGERLEAVITFADAGASKEADEICALSKGASSAQ